ncbi:sigma-54 interaction domain-containing protein [Lysobacter yangpyeongensis]|uniref:Sigma-54 interaction domain-containing protein n=1 Tax=Lysobacter yangpyeongensis TaxID=346182 RepID=A0ABW0SJI1_9GAMM
MEALRSGIGAVAGDAVADGSAISPLSEIIGQSPAYLRLVAQIRKMAGNDASVLIEGETGAGKELAARAVHYLSRRRERPFVPLNCGAIPESLVEAELFGHVRGSFTDAKHNREGVIAHAQGGTLFLDEIETLSPKGQVALLRFLQDRRYRPVGHSREQLADVRVVAATNKPMPRIVAEGQFRSDLLYRLNVLNLRVPPLRERVEDIVPLATHFVALFCERYGLGAKRLDHGTGLWMQQYDWPGNVRELENLVHRLVLFCDGDVLYYAGDPDDEPADRTCPDFRRAKAAAIASFERTYLTRLMRETNGNISAAARMACKERRALGKLLKKHGIDKDVYRA